MTFASILRHARTAPDKTALAVSGNATSYRLFAKLIAAAREWIAQALPAGDGIFATCTRDPLADWAVIHALRSLGRTAIAVPDMETLARLALPGLSGVIVLSAGQAGSAPGGAQVCVLPIAILLEAGSRPLPDNPGEHPPGDFIEFTSGSTGAYKAVVRRGGEIGEMCRRAARDYRLEAGTVFHFLDLPPWASVGSKCPTTLWSLGGTCVYDYRSDRLDHLFEFPVNHMFAPPRLLRTLAQRDHGPPRPDLQVYTGGGFVTFEDARDLRNRLGCTVYLSFAGTEIGVRLQSRVEAYEDVIWLSATEEDGVEIVDADGAVLEAGRAGELRVRLHANDPVEYLGNPAASAEMFRGGYFHTGDLAIRSKDGRVRILGRTADVLNFGGIKRPVGPFEARAREMLGGGAVCLFVRQDDSGKEVLHVMVETEAELAQDRIGAFTQTFSAIFPHIALHRVAGFPRLGGMQKIDRTRLVAMIAASPAQTG